MNDNIYIIKGMSLPKKLTRKPLRLVTFDGFEEKALVSYASGLKDKLRQYLNSCAYLSKDAVRNILAAFDASVKSGVAPQAAFLTLVETWGNDDPKAILYNWQK